MPAIKPDQVVSVKASQIPEYVFDAFNDLIAKNWDGKRSKVLQDDVLSLIATRPPYTSRTEVLGSRWLDVEDIYRAQGWKVLYDGPVYCETYAAFFVFEKDTK